MKVSGQFLRDNFYVLLMAFLFVLTFLFGYYNAKPELAGWLKDINNGVFYGLLALIGVRPLTRPVAPTIQADNIESATTQSGDINLTPKDAPAEDREGKPE